MLISRNKFQIVLIVHLVFNYQTRLADIKPIIFTRTFDYTLILNQYLCGNAKSWSEAVIDHLVGSQGQHRGDQVHAMNWSDQKGWNQDPPLPRPT